MHRVHARRNAGYFPGRHDPRCCPRGRTHFGTPSITLKGAPIQKFCAAPEAYGEIGRQAIRDRTGWKPISSDVCRRRKAEAGQSSIQVSGTGEDRQLVHVFQDCADLQTLEKRLLQSERLATVGKFASQIAHEIRNPLNSISLNVELLEDEVASNPEARGLIRSVLKELGPTE